MTINTLVTLKAALATWSERSDLTSQMGDFVTYAHQEIARTLRASVNTVRATLSITGEYVAHPTGFRAIRRLHLDTTPRRLVVPTSAEGRMDMTAQYSTTTYPTHVSIEGSEFGFAPIPNATTASSLLYYGEPTALVNESDTNAVLTKYPFMYLYGGLSELFRYIEDDNNATRYETRFQGLMASVNANESKDATSGPIQGSPYPGGIV